MGGGGRIRSLAPGNSAASAAEPLRGARPVRQREREPLDAAADDLAELATDNDATAVKLLRARFESAREKRIYTACGALLCEHRDSDRYPLPVNYESFIRSGVGGLSAFPHA